MRIVYIAGKYRALDTIGVVHNIQVARHYAEKYWNMGYAVICPHANSGWMEANVPEQILMEGDLDIIKRCDIIVMIPGWEDSVGAINEHATALQYGVKVIYEV